jgi:hypothetical protein
MSITYDGVIQQILNALGAVAGPTPATADANFTASPSTSTVIGPDFVPSMIQPALASSLSEIVEAIASTPLNPERQRYADVTASLANFDAIPQTGNGGARIIGVPGYVKDASDNIACLPNTLDAIRSYNRFAATIYDGFTPYWYAINSDRIEHTRPGVIMGVCVWTRPTTFTGAIPCEEWHEGGLVSLSVAKLALKESMFVALYEGANSAGQAHLTQIRNYGQPAAYGLAQAAPSST